MAWTSPKTFSANAVLTASELNTHLRDNLKALTEWTTYTPTWAGTGGTPTIGNGTLTGRYLVAGDLCQVSIKLLWGSTTTANSATAWTFSLPVTAAGSAVLTGVANDFGTAVYLGSARIDSGNTTAQFFADAGSTAWGATTPFTWTNQDAVYVSGTYEV